MLMDEQGRASARWTKPKPKIIFMGDGVGHIYYIVRQAQAHPTRGCKENSE